MHTLGLAEGTHPTLSPHDHRRKLWAPSSAALGMLWRSLEEHGIETHLYACTAIEDAFKLQLWTEPHKAAHSQQVLYTVDTSLDRAPDRLRPVAAQGLIILQKDLQPHLWKKSSASLTFSLIS